MFEVITNFSLMIPIPHEGDLKGLLKSLHLELPFTAHQHLGDASYLITPQGLYFAGP
jgi:hypothetical protein